nr:MAG TPA: SOS-response transcriptional repressor [Caudoviricetes sp.]
MTLKELIKLKQKDWGMTRAEIASRIGVGYTFFSAILCGTTKLPEETLKTMLKRLDFSGCEERWLIAYFIRQSGKLPLSLLGGLENAEAVVDGAAEKIIELYYAERPSRKV